MKKQLLIGMALLFLLVACQNNDNGNRNGDNAQGNVEQTRYNNADNGLRNIDTGDDGKIGTNDNNNNTRYEVDKEAADRIEKDVTEVDRAHVFTTNNNAYVALGLKNENSNAINNNNNNLNKNNMNNNNNNNNNNNLNKNNKNNMNNNNNNNNNNININNNNNNINNNNMNNSAEVSDDVQRRVADIVKSVDNDINQVYVSAHPDFYNLTDDYVNNNHGYPEEGFFNRFGNMVDRLFHNNNNNR